MGKKRKKPSHNTAHRVAETWKRSQMRRIMAAAHANRQPKRLQLGRNIVVPTPAAARLVAPVLPHHVRQQAVKVGRSQPFNRGEGFGEVGDELVGAEQVERDKAAVGRPVALAVNQARLGVFVSEGARGLVGVC